MTFSFVLPAYKGRYLSESIDSILAQDYKDFELIIVDDCSPDHLDEIVAKYNDPRISYYKNEKNIGGKDLVAQWNHCLEYATGDYVILATDDDLYESTFLSSFVPLILKYPDVNIFRARILQVDCNNDIKYIDKCYKEFLSEIEFRYYMMHGIRGGIPHYIFTRKVLEKYGGFVNFPVAWGSDDATAMMMAKNGIVNSQEHLVRFRWSDINLSSDQVHTGIPKLKARILLAKWMIDNEPTMTPQKEWIPFFTQEVSAYLPIYIKSLLIIRLSAIPLTQWGTAISIINNSNLLPFLGNCSIVYHSIRRKFL